MKQVSKLNIFQMKFIYHHVLENNANICLENGVICVKSNEEFYADGGTIWYKWGVLNHKGWKKL